MSVHASKKSSYSYLQEVGAAVFSAFFLSACAASASENVTIHQSEDMQPWQQNAWDNVFDGSKNGQSSGNVFLFDVANTDEEALTGFAFHAASSAPEQAENLIHIQNGYFRARGTQTAFVASYGAEKNASNNRLLVSGGNFLKATGVNFPDDHVILMTAAEGDADLAGNSIVVSGGRFEAPTEMTAALNTSDKLNVLSDNIIRLQAPAQIENWSALTAAVAEGGLLTRNRIEVEGVKSQKIDMLVAAHTEFGDASQNTVVVKDSDIYVRSGIHAAEATSSTPSMRPIKTAPPPLKSTAVPLSILIHPPIRRGRVHPMSRTATPSLRRNRRTGKPGTPSTGRPTAPILSRRLSVKRRTVTQYGLPETLRKPEKPW